MEIGIIGLPRSGKTTIFNAVTKGSVSVNDYSHKLNVRIAKVPDKRLNILAEIYKPKRVVPAEVTYTDIPPPPEGFGETRGISGEYLNAIQSVDALLLVVRAFNNPSVSHVDESIDPLRDIENMFMEMTFSDLGIIERRIERIREGFKGANQQERGNLTREQTLLLRLQEGLNVGISLNEQHMSSNEIKSLSGFGFLSIKPIIVVMNISEEQLPKSDMLANQLKGTLVGQKVRYAVICAQLEMDLAQMGRNEEEEFRIDYGVVESSLQQIIRISYDVVNQISFFTVGEDEVRAWEIKRNTIAQIAAGRIHSDLERGFIRAEVISYENLVKCGGLGEAKKLGLVRREGKDYEVQDGEIMHVLFNV